LRKVKLLESVPCDGHVYESNVTEVYLIAIERTVNIVESVQSIKISAFTALGISFN
jgi:hypothetical protein